MKKLFTSTYLTKDNKTLFLVRKKENDHSHIQGIFLPIGGKVEESESLEESAKREVLEESGIRINSLNLKAILYIIGQGGTDDLTIFIFESADFRGRPRSGKEGSFIWISNEEIEKKANLYEGDKILLKLMKDHSFVVLELHYKGFEFLSHKILKAI